MKGVDTGDSRVPKSRRTSKLSVERVGLGHVLVGAALHQVGRWSSGVDCRGRRSSSRHLRVSTPACSSGQGRGGGREYGQDSSCWTMAAQYGLHGGGQN